MCLLMCCSCCTLSIRVSVKSELLPFLPCLLSCGLHGTLQRALKRLQLARCLLQQKPSHKLLQVCGLLVILHVRGKEFIVYNSSLHLHQGSVNWMQEGRELQNLLDDLLVMLHSFYQWLGMCGFLSLRVLHTKCGFTLVDKRQLFCPSYSLFWKKKNQF